MTADFRNDIPEGVARLAHAGTSFVPEDRARQERDSYAATLAGDLEALTRYADTDAKREQLAAEFERYRSGFRTRYLAMLAAKSRCMSTMITGGSGFPVRRQERRSDVADKRTAELVDFRERALAAIRKALRPELAPIMAGDADAVPRLDEKAEKAASLLSLMKAANAVIRKHAKAGAPAQIPALLALGLTEAQAGKLLERDELGRIGFADYQIRNLSANVRRMSKRSAAIEVAKAEPVTALVGSLARLEDSPGDNRVRIFFPGKPDQATRSRLKSAGFRWSPTIGAWQAYRNHAALTMARREIGEVETESA